VPRPREFDEQHVVARATDLFWRRGYHATGVRELGEELELSASSLYRTFGDKHGLFLRALEHYRATETTEAHARLEQPGPVRRVLRDWLVGMVEGAVTNGCFVVNTATELGPADPAVDARIQAAFEVTREALHHALDRGRRGGELPAELDVDAAAETLFSLVLGLEVRARAGHAVPRLAAVIEAALLALLGPEPVRPAGHR
jgi:TetR/AcrR family transcriptional repressor of nem operon